MEHPTDTIPTAHIHSGCEVCGKQMVCFPAETLDSPYLTTPREVITEAAKLAAHMIVRHGEQFAAAGCFEPGITPDEIALRMSFVVEAYKTVQRISESESYGLNAWQRMFPWLR